VSGRDPIDVLTLTRRKHVQRAGRLPALDRLQGLGRFVSGVLREVVRGIRALPSAEPDRRELAKIAGRAVAKLESTR